MKRRTVTAGRVSAPRPAARAGASVRLFTVGRDMPDAGMRRGDRLAVDAMGRVTLTRTVALVDLARASALADAEMPS